MHTGDAPLTERTCKACNANTPPLKGGELQNYFDNLANGWTLVDDHHLLKSWRFKNFQQALNFTVRIGELSEKEGHHPDIHLSWGKVKVTIFTHVIDALSENDFIWAAKADQLYEEQV